MKKVKRMEKENRPKHLHKVEKIPGMSNAFGLVNEYSIFGSGGDPREYGEEKAKEIRRKGVRKIAELWKLSESEEKILIKKWVETKRQKIKDRKSYEPMDIRSIFKVRYSYVPRDPSEDSEIEILLGDEEENVRGFNKIKKKLSKRKAILSDSSKVKKGNIYLDVTEIDFKTFRRVYKDIKLCRSELGMNKRDTKRGAPESIDERIALLAAEANRAGMSRKEIAKRMGFKIYKKDNPSGSFPLLHKYIKMGREMAKKLDKLEKYLQEMTGIKV
jgi:hypothetical protein